MSGQKAARAAARKLLEDFGVREPGDIRVEDIAWCLGADIIHGGLYGAGARLTVRKKFARIRIPEGEDPNRARFSIGHEIGHLALHREHLADVPLVCDFKDWRRQSIEAEANAFSAELLLPATMIEKRCARPPSSFRQVEELATEFRTSLTATAINFSRLCKLPCAVVLSKDGHIKWGQKNQHWGLRLFHRGSELDPRTAAAQVDDAAGRRLDGAHTPSHAWIPGAPSNLRLEEHALKMRDPSYVLSFLILP